MWLSPIEGICLVFIEPVDVRGVEAIVANLKPGTRQRIPRQIFDGKTNGVGRSSNTLVSNRSASRPFGLAGEQLGASAVVNAVHCNSLG